MTPRRASFLMGLSVALCEMAAFADGAPNKSFTVGSGSQFRFSIGGASGELLLSVADSSSNRVALEYYFSVSQGMYPVEMWQQYVLELSGQAPPRLAEGYIFGRGLKGAERVPKEYLTGLDGLAVSDFLFSTKAQLDKLKIREERIFVLAAPQGTLATRYQQQQRGQTFTYWISDDAKPIGLVRLVSCGPKPAQNYEIELMALLKNVGRKIDPATAGPLSAEGRALLNLPGR